MSFKSPPMDWLAFGGMNLRGSLPVTTKCALVLMLFGLLCGSRLQAEPTSEAGVGLTCTGPQLPACEEMGAALQAQKKISEALVLYARACRQGSGVSCSKVAWHFHRDGNRSDSYTAFHRACALDHGPSCLYLGTLSAEDGAQRIAYQRACDHGVSLACQRIGLSAPLVMLKNEAAPVSGCLSIGGEACKPKTAENRRGISILKADCQLGHSASCFSLRAADREAEGRSPVSGH